MDALLWTRAEDHRATLALAHGAGVGMTSPFMEQIAGLLADRGVSVARFEFPYMAERRHGGAKRPPPRADKLIEPFAEACRAVLAENLSGPLAIGGKSLGGRVAAMLAGQSDDADGPTGVVCLGYPFHPPGRPEQLRLAPLQDAAGKTGCPVLICQGDRDPFGNAAEIEGYSLPRTVSVSFLEDGDHDFKPRGRSPATWKGNLAAAADHVAAFLAALPH